MPRADECCRMVSSLIKSTVPRKIFSSRAFINSHIDINMYIPLKLGYVPRTNERKEKEKKKKKTMTLDIQEEKSSSPHVNRIFTFLSKKLIIKILFLYTKSICIFISSDRLLFTLHTCIYNCIYIICTYSNVYFLCIDWYFALAVKKRKRFRKSCKDIR